MELKGQILADKISQINKASKQWKHEFFNTLKGCFIAVNQQQSQTEESLVCSSVMDTLYSNFQTHIPVCFSAWDKAY